MRSIRGSRANSPWRRPPADAPAEAGSRAIVRHMSFRHWDGPRCRAWFVKGVTHNDKQDSATRTGRGDRRLRRRRSGVAEFGCVLTGFCEWRSERVKHLEELSVCVSGSQPSGARPLPDLFPTRTIHAVRRVVELVGLVLLRVAGPSHTDDIHGSGRDTAPNHEDPGHHTASRRERRRPRSLRLVRRTSRSGRRGEGSPCE